MVDVAMAGDSKTGRSWAVANSREMVTRNYAAILRLDQAELFFVGVRNAPDHVLGLADRRNCRPVGGLCCCISNRIRRHSILAIRKHRGGVWTLWGLWYVSAGSGPVEIAGGRETAPPTSFSPQENGDHVYTTNTAFETTKPGTWRIESARGFVRPLGGSGIIAPAISVGDNATPIARAASIIDVDSAFSSGLASTSRRAVQPISLSTKPSAINPDSISTAVDVGLIAPWVPSDQPQVSIGDPADDKATDLIPQELRGDNEEPDDTDNLFASLGSTEYERLPW